MIAKLEYSWHEGEYGYCYVTHSKKSIDQFEQDLKDIKSIIIKNMDKYHNDYGKSEFIKCTTSFYELIQTYLEEYGYNIEDYCSINTYDVDYDSYNTLEVKRKDTKITWKPI